MPESLYILIAFLLGAWVSHRARNGQSPLPSLPKREEKPAEEAKMKLPKVEP